MKLLNILFKVSELKMDVEKAEKKINKLFDKRKLLMDYENWIGYYGEAETNDIINEYLNK